MTLSDKQSERAAELRRRAEKIVRQLATERPRMIENLPPEAIRMMLYELQVHQVELELHNEDLHRTQAQLEAARERYFNFYNLAPVGFLTVNEEGLILEANATTCALLGVDHEALFGQPLVHHVLAADQGACRFHCRQVFATGKPQAYDLRMVKHNAEPLWVRMETTATRDGAAGPPLCRMVLSDISERKQAEIYLQLTGTVLAIINASDGFRDSVRRILGAIRQATGCDAVGMRLQSGHDYPYFMEEGFSADFLKAENSLVLHDRNNDICRDENGDISLGCTCGLVISGKTDPDGPLFTAAGSCYTNNSVTLLDIPAGADPRRDPRNRCIHDGYLSVALIPIRTKNRIVGLLQLNDSRKDRFRLETIHSLERIAGHIGEALLRKQIEEKLATACAELVSTRKAAAIRHGTVFDREANG